MVKGLDTLIENDPQIKDSVEVARARPARKSGNLLLEQVVPIRRVIPWRLRAETLADKFLKISLAVLTRPACRQKRAAWITSGKMTQLLCPQWVRFVDYLYASSKASMLTFLCCSPSKRSSKSVLSRKPRSSARPWQTSSPFLLSLYKTPEQPLFYIPNEFL